MAGEAEVYKFIMLSSRTLTESESAFFSQNLPKPTAYNILRTVTTLLTVTVDSKDFLHSILHNEQ